MSELSRPDRPKIEHPIEAEIRKLKEAGKRPCIERCGREADSGAYCWECRGIKATR